MAAIVVAAALAVFLACLVLGPILHMLAVATTIMVAAGTRFRGKCPAPPAVARLALAALAMSGIAIAALFLLRTADLHPSGYPYPVSRTLSGVSLSLALAALIAHRLCAPGSRVPVAAWGAIILSAYAPLMGPMLAGDVASQAVAEERETLRPVASALQLYLADNDDAFPDPAYWCDQLLPYLEDERLLMYPSGSSQRSAYAFNSGLAGLTHGVLADPERTIVIFESDAGWNAAGGPELLPVPPRHASSRGWGYDWYIVADGFVRRMSRSQLPDGSWEKERHEDSAIWEPVIKDDSEHP